MATAIEHHLKNNHSLTPPLTSNFKVLNFQVDSLTNPLELPTSNDLVKNNKEETSQVNWKVAAKKLPNLFIPSNERLAYLSAIKQLLRGNASEVGSEIASSITRTNANLTPNLAVKIEQELALACELTEHLADGILLIQLLEQRLTINGSDTEQYLSLNIKLAQNLAHMGMFERASTIVELALLAHPFDHKLLITANDIQAQWRAIPYDLADCRSHELMLIPLTSQYMSDYYWQYSDPSIQALCNLPHFTTGDEWLHWLAQNNNMPEQRVFAVLHKDWGFIGSVSIEVFQGVGFFYYWLGTDFQGQGFGPQAVNLLLALAQKYFTMDCCYAKVYQHNQPSHKAMLKLGFSALIATTKAPYDNEIFYYAGPKQTNWDNYRELEWLLKMQCSMAELEGPKECLYVGNA